MDKNKIKKKYKTTYKGKKWWSRLTNKERHDLLEGYKRNSIAEETQKKEIEFNKLKRSRKK